MANRNERIEKEELIEKSILRSRCCQSRGLGASFQADIDNHFSFNARSFKSPGYSPKFPPLNAPFHAVPRDENTTESESPCRCCNRAPSSPENSVNRRGQLGKASNPKQDVKNKTRHLVGDTIGFCTDFHLITLSNEGSTGEHTGKVEQKTVRTIRQSRAKVNKRAANESNVKRDETQYFSN